MTVVKQTTVNTDKDVRKEEPLFTSTKSVKWWRHYGNQYEGLSKNKDRITICRGKIPRQRRRASCSPVFIDAPFPIARKRRQAWFPSAEEWKKKINTYTQRNFVSLWRRIQLWHSEEVCGTRNHYARPNKPSSGRRVSFFLSCLKSRFVGGAWEGKRGLRGGGCDLNGQVVGTRECHGICLSWK